MNDDQAPGWVLPPDDGSMGDGPPPEEVGLTDDGELTFRGEVVPLNDWRVLLRRFKREAAQEMPKNFVSARPPITRLRMAPHVRPREQRTRTRCQNRAGPDDSDEGGDGDGPPSDLTTPPSVAELLDRLRVLIPSYFIAEALVRRWTA